MVFANNLLEIAVAPGNPKHITGLADLANPSLKVVIEDPSQPAGKYTAEALAKLEHRRPPGVGTSRREVDFGHGDVRQRRRRRGVCERCRLCWLYGDGRARFRLIRTSLAVYPIAILKSSKNQAADKAFVNEIVSGTGQQALKNAGFLPPNVTSSPF